MSENNFEQLFKSFANVKVGVVGDVMLDTYWWGRVDRISPEAPVPVVSVTHREERIGGAGNVALNIMSLGATVQMVSVAGNDGDGKQLQTLLKKNNIATDYFLHSDERMTTNKIRIISRNQHMMRLDAEITQVLNEDDENKLLQAVEKYIANNHPNIIILEDYNKGVLTETAIQRIISLCKKNGILTSVDPKRKNFFAYKGVDIFKPNLNEARESLNIIEDEISLTRLSDIHQSLHEKLNHEISLITLSEKGMYYEGGNEKALIPTHIRNVADVSGAGDTVIAVASLVYAATKNKRLMAEMANIAGGLVCEEVGTVAINKDKLLAECNSLLYN